MVGSTRGAPHVSRRVRRDPDAVRERLYRVSLRRIRDQGYEAASVAGITREADVAKGTFFNYFPTKEHILARYLDEVLDRILPRGLDSGGGTDAVAQALDDVALELAGEPELARAVIPRLGLGGLPGPPSAPHPSSSKKRTTQGPSPRRRNGFPGGSWIDSPNRCGCPSPWWKRKMKCWGHSSSVPSR